MRRLLRFMSQIRSGARYMRIWRSNNSGGGGSRRNLKGIMPFRKVGKNRYKSPSGRIYTARQVRAYYATGGFRKKRKRRRK